MGRATILTAVLVLFASVKDARAQHVTESMAATLAGQSGVPSCQGRAREALSLLDALNASLERARRSNDETAMRTAADAAHKGFADLKARLEACRPGATTTGQAPAPPATPQTPAKPSATGVDHAAMGHGTVAGVAAVPTTVRQISSAAEAALQAFQDALQVGNRDVAWHWLTPDVAVTESGVTHRSRDDYAGAHMALDMTFLKTAKVVLVDRQVHPAGDSTHIMSTSRITGRAGEVAVAVTVTEGALLKKTPDGWRIASLEWTIAPVAASR